MSIIRPFQATDLLRINNVNIDAWTETASACGAAVLRMTRLNVPETLEQYRASFYLEYCATWPDYSCVVTDAHSEKITAYGKQFDVFDLDDLLILFALV